MRLPPLGACWEAKHRLLDVRLPRVMAERGALDVWLPPWGATGQLSLGSQRVAQDLVGLGGVDVWLPPLGARRQLCLRQQRGAKG